jgi:hypothetical protein
MVYNRPRGRKQPSRNAQHQHSTSILQPKFNRGENEGQQQDSHTSSNGLRSGNRLHGFPVHIDFKGGIPQCTFQRDGATLSKEGGCKNVPPSFSGLSTHRRGGYTHPPTHRVLRVGLYHNGRVSNAT